MNGFYSIICEIMEHMKNGDCTVLEDRKESLKQEYEAMPEQSQWDSLGVIAEAFKQKGQFQIWLLSYLLYALRDEKVVYFLENSLLEERILLIDRSHILRQLKKALFVYPIAVDEVRHRTIQNEIYAGQMVQFRKALDYNLTYVPYAKRNQKRVVLMIEPLLGEAHAPTAKTVNLYNWLQKLGYEVVIFATNVRQLELAREGQWCGTRYDSCVLEETGKFCVNLLGTEVNGYSLNYTDASYLDELKRGKAMIAEYNPAFILTIGDANILADLCGDFTTVCTMACVNWPAQTTNNVIVRYFRCTEEENQRYLSIMKPEQKIVELCHTEELVFSHGKAANRKDYGINENAFVILVAGNRLDFEISGEVKQVFCQILEQNDVLFVFIGDCPKLKEELTASKQAGHYRFLGRVQDFCGIMKLGNLFLNPPRQGGGTGGAYAIKNEVPVLTLSGCDVAQVGEAFTCEKLQDMPEIVNRYIHDTAYMERQKENCRKSTKAIFGVDNLESVKHFCSELKSYILEAEKREREG